MYSASAASSESGVRASDAGASPSTFSFWAWRGGRSAKDDIDMGDMEGGDDSLTMATIQLGKLKFGGKLLSSTSWRVGRAGELVAREFVAGELVALGRGRLRESLGSIFLQLVPGLALTHEHLKHTKLWLACELFPADRRPLSNPPRHQIGGRTGHGDESLSRLGKARRQGAPRPGRR